MQEIILSKFQVHLKFFWSFCSFVEISFAFMKTHTFCCFRIQNNITVILRWISRLVLTHTSHVSIFPVAIYIFCLYLSLKVVRSIHGIHIRIHFIAHNRKFASRISIVRPENCDWTNFESFKIIYSYDPSLGNKLFGLWL